MNQTEKYIQSILDQLQSSPLEREEIDEELRNHLQESKEQYKSEGYTETQAEKQALADFGKSNNIGKELQEAMYPHQRGLLYAIGFALIFYGVVFYLDAAFLQHDPIKPITIWLAIQLLLGSAVTLAAVNIPFIGKYFYFLHLLIMTVITWSSIDFVIARSLQQWQATLFSLYLVALLVASLIFVFQNSYYSSVDTNKKQQKSAWIKFSYIINLLYSLVVIAFALFTTWALLAFAESRVWSFLPLLSIIVWLIFYKFQMKYVTKKPILSTVTGLLFVGLAAIIPFLISWLIRI